MQHTGGDQRASVAYVRLRQRPVAEVPARHWTVVLWTAVLPARGHESASDGVARRAWWPTTGRETGARGVPRIVVRTRRASA